MGRYQLYLVLGALGGLGVTAAFWFGLGTSTPWAVFATLAGGVVGALLGLLVGDGSVQQAWAGWFGAFLIPPIGIALLNGVVIVLVGAHGR